MYVLGLSAFYHDSAATLIKNGEIIAAVQEERFSRKKGDASFPLKSIDFILSSEGISIEDIDHIVYYENSRKKLNRLVWNSIAFAPRSYGSFVRSMSSFLRGKLYIERTIQRLLGTTKEVKSVDHHMSHAASAYFPSPYEDSAVLTLDGVGEWSTMTIGIGQGNQLHLLQELRYPHSLGLLYSAFTYYCGFKVNSGEYKLMGLAPYGQPKYAESIFKHIVDLKDDGSFRLNLKYFEYFYGQRMTSDKFHELFGGPPRSPEAEISQIHMDLAASIQVVVEEIVLRLAKTAKSLTQKDSLCLAGGVALNCVANGRLIKEKIFKNIWIQPAAGDAGASLGAALYYYYHIAGQKRRADGSNDWQKGSYLGPRYASQDIAKYLDRLGASYERLETDSILAEKISGYLSEGKVVGLFQGKMEFGPRALGNRSILGDPRNPKMQKQMNLKIKYRESFRPFAPAVLEDRASEFFDIEEGIQSPYMLIVAGVRDNIRVKVPQNYKDLVGLDKLNVVRSSIPAVTHVNYSARIQTVNDTTNPFFAEVLRKFDQLTGCPILINTSFNVRGEPIVCDFKDAYECFMRTEMDILVLEDHILTKSDQPDTIGTPDWQNEFPLD